MTYEQDALVEEKKRRDEDEGSMLPIEFVGEQPLSDEDELLRQEAYARLAEWQKDCHAYHVQADKCRKVYMLNDPDQDLPGTPEDRKALQLQTLKSTINNCVADQMDNTPEAMLIPQNASVQPIATEMTSVINYILEQNDYGTYHRERVEDFYITGTSVTQVGWDEEMDNGQGNIYLARHPIENILWDPMAEDVQDARAIIKLSWHPRSWFAEHWPDTAKYIADETNDHEDVGVPESALNVLNEHEGRSLLMEYWYRRYNAKNKRYTINVAYFAGNALLDKQTNVYAHGRYPFVFDAFTRIKGQPVGEGMVKELTPMMQYINRYAQYIDENLRYSCKTRMLVRNGAEIDMEALADWNQNVITGNRIAPDQDVRWLETKPLNGMVSNQMVQFQNDMKMDSGQNQFARGEAAGGITAASAISALQDAGSKITRMRTAVLSANFKKIVEQMLWLVAQYYDEDRQAMILGDDLMPKTITLSAEYLMRQKRAKDGHFPPPPYTVQIQIQRRNPMRVQAQNDLFIQAYTMSAQAGNNFPLSLLFELLNVDGKERILPRLRELDQQREMMQQMQMQMQQLQEENANLHTSLDSYANALAGSTDDLQSAAFGGSEKSNPTVAV